MPDGATAAVVPLAERCEYETRYLGSNEHWHREIKRHFGARDRDSGFVRLDVLGVRAWYRTALVR